ncbi:uncharacterized protein FYW23_000730 [Sylvia borin]
MRLKEMSLQGLEEMRKNGFSEYFTQDCKDPPGQGPHKPETCSTGWLWMLEPALAVGCLTALSLTQGSGLLCPQPDHSRGSPRGGGSSLCFVLRCGKGLRAAVQGSRCPPFPLSAPTLAHSMEGARKEEL